MYYLLIMVSTIMFGLQFFFNKQYQQKEGAGIEKAILFALGTSAVTAIAMLAINRLRIEFTWFSFGLSMVSAMDGILFLYCSTKALSKVNLSLYSLFSMLGGMLLPFFAGICFFGEALTTKKLLSTAVITIALFIGMDRKANRTALWLCLYVFVLNGMAGVLSKWHQSGTGMNLSSGGFMLLKSLVTIAICAILLLFSKKSGFKLNDAKSAVKNITGYGLMTGFANYFILIALLHVNASVQYPMITGGTIIVSTLISVLSKEKVTGQNIISSLLALFATLLLL